MRKILTTYIVAVFFALGLALLVQAQNLNRIPSGDILFSARGDRNSVNITNQLTRRGTTRVYRAIFDAGIWTFSNNVTFKSNVNVEIREGAVWNVKTGSTVDLDRCGFDAPFGLPWFGGGVVKGSAKFLWNKKIWGPESPAGNKDPGTGEINVAFINTTNWATTAFVGRVSGALTINISTNDNVQDIINLMTNIGFVDIGGKLTFQWADGDHFYASALDFFGNIGGAGQVCLLGNTNDPSACRVNFTNNSSGFEVMDNGTINLLDGFTVIGTDTNGVEIGVFSRNSSSLACGTNMIVKIWPFGFGASQAGELFCNGGRVFDCARGVTASLNGTIVGDNMFIGTNAIGAQSGGSSFLKISDSTVTNNTIGINALFNGFVQAENTITNGNLTATVPVTNVTGTTQGFISRL